MWEKSIFFSSSFHSNIGKSTIQASAKLSWSTSSSSCPTLSRAAPAKAMNGRVAGDEEHRVADVEIELLADRGRALRPDILGDRSGAAFLSVAEEDVAEARLALLLRPVVHAVAEGAVAAARRRDRPHLVRFVALEHARRRP